MKKLLLIFSIISLLSFSVLSWAGCEVLIHPNGVGLSDVAENTKNCVSIDRDRIGLDPAIYNSLVKTTNIVGTPTTYGKYNFYLVQTHDLENAVNNINNGIIDPGLTPYLTKKPADGTYRLDFEKIKQGMQNKHIK